MSKYKLVCSDLDGTLLRRDMTVSEENKRAIKEMTKLGTAFVASSGRAHPGRPKDVVECEVQSITTSAKQTLYIDGADAEYMKGKRILIVDDVISTGESLRALEQLVLKAGGEIVGRMAILAEGDAIDRKDITYLAPLPLFDGNGNAL